MPLLIKLAAYFIVNQLELWIYKLTNCDQPL